MTEKLATLPSRQSPVSRPCCKRGAYLHMAGPEASLAHGPHLHPAPAAGQRRPGRPARRAARRGYIGGAHLRRCRAAVGAVAGRGRARCAGGCYPLYVRDVRPAAETRYRARFRLHPMASPCPQAIPTPFGFWLMAAGGRIELPPACQVPLLSSNLKYVYG